MSIEVRGLSKRFPATRKGRAPVEAVHDVTFSVAPGERLAYIGPNGAGKSTSIKMLTGILHPTSGDARVLGLVPWEDRRRLAGRIGTLFGQRSQLWFELAPRDSFRMLAAIFGLADDVAAVRVAELGDLLDAEALFDVPVRSLSLGQRMRCELAACMLHHPEILFLDEPTIGLDLLAKQRFRDLLVRLNEERGTTVFLTSHDVADIEHVAQRAIVVNHGTIIRDAAVPALRRSLLATKRIEVGLDHAIDLAGAGEWLGAGVVAEQVAESVVRVDVDTSQRRIKDVVDAILDAWPVADLSVVDPPLEQVIAEIYEAPVEHPGP